MLAPDWTRCSRITVGVLTVITLGTAGISIFLRVQAQDLSDLSGLWGVWMMVYVFASPVADAAVFIGALFLVRVLLPMGDGAFARPYLLMCFSAAIYLAFDLTDVLADLGAFGTFDRFQGPLGKLVSLADGTALAAGLAQAQFMRGRATQ